jgi:enoyl-CoA hydratase
MMAHLHCRFARTMSSQADAPLVLVEHPQPGCALVTLNRPRVRNALSMALRRQFVQVFAALREDPSLRVVVLTGAGEAFCAGLDLKELGGARDPGSTIQSGPQEDPTHAIADFPWPVIAAVNGPAITGGFELALACDFMLASSQARFADTHARVGVMPGWGLSQKLQRLIGVARAKEMAFTGNFIDAHQALAWGLVNRVLPPDELRAQSLQLAADIAGVLPQALRTYKALIDEGGALPLGEALRLERERCAQWARGMDPGAVEARRQAVIERGRGQT